MGTVLYRIRILNVKRWQNFLAIHEVSSPHQHLAHIAKLSNLSNLTKRSQMVSLRIRPAIILFGDSITQQGFGYGERGVGWASLLARDYSRRADIFNRGYSGYNTRMAVEELLPNNEVFGTPPGDNGVLFCTVFFGANDAALPGERQHVPIEEYGSNLAKIVTTIR